MQAKIIQFPKNSTQYHAFYYFREYFSVVLHTAVAWSFMVFVLIYEHTNFALGVGFGVWLVGIALMVNYIIKLGLKRKEQEALRRQHIHINEDN